MNQHDDSPYSHLSTVYVTGVRQWTGGGPKPCSNLESGSAANGGAKLCSNWGSGSAECRSKTSGRTRKFIKTAYTRNCVPNINEIRN